VTTGILSGESVAQAVAIQSDGRIVAGGPFLRVRWFRRYRGRPLQRGWKSGLRVFASGGKVTTAIGATYDQAYGLALQSDGKILVAGSSANGNDDDMAVVRYTANGSLDATFGSSGKVDHRLRKKVKRLTPWPCKATAKSS